MYLLRIKQSGSNLVTHRAVADPCAIIRTGFRDLITVHLDWRSQIVGVSISARSPAPKVTGSKSKNQFASAEDSDAIKTKVVVQQMESGPQPDTAPFVQKLEEEKLAKQRGDVPDNRSFFAKYWMYIIPVVLVLAMNSGGPEQGGGGGGR